MKSLGPSLVLSCCTCDGDRGHLDDPADGNNGSEDLGGCATEETKEPDKHKTRCCSLRE